MTCMIGGSPRPPYSLGQVMAARPASAFRRWKSLARRRPSASPWRAAHVSKAPALRSAVASRKRRHSARKAASWSVSRKSMAISFLRPPARFEARDEPILPGAGAAQGEGQELGAAVVEMAVELPGEAHAAVGLDVLLRGEEEGLGGADAGGGRGHGQLGGIGGEGPGSVVRVGASQLQGDVDVDELVLDRLERRDRTAESEAAQGVLAGHVEGGLSAAHLLEGEEDGGAIEDAPGQRPALGAPAEGLDGGALEGEASVRARGIDRGHRG